MKYRSWFEFKTKNTGFSESEFLVRVILFLSRVTTITKKIFGNNSKEFARINSLVGFLNSMSQNFWRAIPFYHLSLDIYEDLEKTDKKYYTDCLINLGIVYVKTEDYSNAAKYLNKALKSDHMRSRSFSGKYLRCIKYSIEAYSAFINEKNDFYMIKSSTKPDFSVINDEVTKLCIENCEISKRIYGFSNPKRLEGYLMDVFELQTFSSDAIAEPYYREIDEFLKNIDDSKSKKYYFAKCLLNDFYSNKSDQEQYNHKNYVKDNSEGQDGDHSSLNSVYGDMQSAMSPNDTFASQYSKNFKNNPLAKYDEPLETVQESESEKPILINGLANNLNDNDLKSQIKCSLFSVHEASPGDDILIQVFTHYLEKTQEAFKLAKEFDAESSLRQSKTLDVEVKKESILTFELEINDISINDPIQQLKWKGVTESVQFIITIPDSYARQSLIGKVRVSLDNVPIGHFCFKIGISVLSVQKKDIGQINFPPMKNYRYAFISYASKDRAEVLRRVQMLDIMKIRYFQDLLSLNPGDQWGKELFRQIDNADVFFLFWSSAARDSEWVLKEVEYAINRKKGNNDNPPEIYSVILESTFVEPPESLKHLHFNDKMVYFI
jgi:hypothetical protein